MARSSQTGCLRDPEQWPSFYLSLRQWMLPYSSLLSDLSEEAEAFRLLQACSAGCNFSKRASEMRTRREKKGMMEKVGRKFVFLPLPSSFFFCSFSFNLWRRRGNPWDWECFRNTFCFDKCMNFLVKEREREREVELWARRGSLRPLMKVGVMGERCVSLSWVCLILSCTKARDHWQSTVALASSSPLCFLAIN